MFPPYYNPLRQRAKEPTHTYLATPYSLVKEESQFFFHHPFYATNSLTKKKKERKKTLFFTQTAVQQNKQKCGTQTRVKPGQSRAAAASSKAKRRGSGTTRTLWQMWAKERQQQQHPRTCCVFLPGPPGFSVRILLTRLPQRHTTGRIVLVESQIPTV